MKGTEKQVKWAEDIKAGAYRILAIMDESNSQLSAKFPKPWETFTDSASPEAIEAVRKELDGFFARCDDAGMIINHRNMFQRDYLIKHCREWMRTH